MSEEKAPYGKPSTVKKITGITITAERHLSADDVEYLKEMIGCEVEYDDNRIYLLPDGEKCHEDYLVLEEVPAKSECLCDNYSELKSVAEELAEALEEILIQLNLSEIEEEFSFEIDKSKSALEKFNKLKENEIL